MNVMICDIAIVLLVHGIVNEQKFSSSKLLNEKY